MPILADNTMNLRTSVIEEMREQQQPLLEAAAKAEQINGRLDTVESDVTALPTIIAGNYTKQLGNYESLAAAIADLPDGGANGGEIQVDGEVPVSATL